MNSYINTHTYIHSYIRSCIHSYILSYLPTETYLFIHISVIGDLADTMSATQNSYVMAFDVCHGDTLTVTACGDFGGSYRHTNTYMHTYLYIHIYLYIHLLIHISYHIYTYLCIGNHTNYGDSYMRLMDYGNYTYTYIYTYIYIYIYIYLNIVMYMGTYYIT